MTSYRQEQIDHLMFDYITQEAVIEKLPLIGVLKVSAKVVLFAQTVAQIKAITQYGRLYRNPFCGCKDFKPYLKKN